nr:beta-ureidopropionase-like [Lytechinus pictus]
MASETESLERILEEHLPADKLQTVNRILYGSSCRVLALPAECGALGENGNFEVKGYQIGAGQEQLRSPRLVRIGLIQNKIVLPTTAPVKEQKDAIHKRIAEIAEAAGKAGVNVLCMQETFGMPFAFCTREKTPWTEFAESAEDGTSVQLCQEAE